MSFLDRFSAKWKVVEISDLPTPLVEDEEAIRSLQHHPGFMALCNRLKLQKAALETELHKRQPTLRNVDILQIGITWLNYLQSEVNKAVNKKKEPVSYQAPLSDIEQFEKAYSQILGV